MTTVLTIEFTDGVLMQVALQRLSTLCSQQRTSLERLTLRPSATGGPVAELVLGATPADRRMQLLKRLDREWSVQSVSVAATVPQAASPHSSGP